MSALLATKGVLLATKAVAIAVGLGVMTAANPAVAAIAPLTTVAGRASVDTGSDTGLDAGVAVFDRRTGRFLQRSQEGRQYRSASLVKLLIAVDYLWDRGPGYEIPAADRHAFELMLRSSDDDAASQFWSRDGGPAIVERMISRLGLRYSAPPPAGRGWGSTVLSAADVVAVYRYLLDVAPAPLRDLVMGNLHQATRCGTDGFDQGFGIEAAFLGTRAVKQGWVNFGDAPRERCTEDAPTQAVQRYVDGPAARSSEAAQTNDVDHVSGALHTTGTVGTHDRFIVAVLSLHAPGTGYRQAYYRLTELTRSLKLPGVRLAPPLPAPPPGTWFGTWSSNVAVRASTTTTSAQVGTVPTKVEVQVRCQVRGEEVVVDDIHNDWWAYLPEFGGYMSNIYFNYPDNQLPNVPAC